MKLRVAAVALAFCSVGFISVEAADTTVVPAKAAQTAGPVASPENDAQLKAMESKFFVHDFSKEPQEYRLQRLEKFVFGEGGKGAPEDRVTKLSKVVDLHKNMVAQAPKAQGASQTQAPSASQSKYSRELDDNQPQQSAHDKMKWVEDYRPRPQSAYARPMESVVPAEQRMSDEERELEEVLQRPELQAGMHAAKSASSEGWKGIVVPESLSMLQQSHDPAVFGDMPPDHHARMLTRVSWCEQHVFGHTFPELHLPQRLHQLSAELLPNQHLSDLELMDHLDLIVREVVMREHPPIAYGK